MWIPFFKPSASASAPPQQDLQDSLPEDLKTFLKDHEPTVTEREFTDTLTRLAPGSKLASPPTAAEIAGQKDSFPIAAPQSAQMLTEAALQSQADLDRYKRENPMLEAVVVNCSEIQAKYFDCISNGPLEKRAKGCIDEQNFHQECISTQLMIFKMFDYDSVDKIRALEEIRGTADVVFNKHYTKYADFNNETINKAFHSELQRRKEKFETKYQR